MVYLGVETGRDIDPVAGARIATQSSGGDGTSLLSALAYSDLFDYPLTAGEVTDLQSGTTYPRAVVEDWLAAETGPEGRVSRLSGYYCLRGREETIASRLRNEQASIRPWRRARLYARWLSRLPYVRMVAATGSLAANNVRDRADIDLLVVAQAGRVWICRRFLIIFVRLARLLRDDLCPNYIISEDELSLQQRDLFTAHELVQMVPLFGAQVYRDLILANSWARAYLPNAFGHIEQRAAPFTSAGRALPQQKHGQHRSSGLERLLRSSLFDAWERWEMRRLQAKLRPFIGADSEVVCTPTQCKGHTNLHRESVMSRYNARLQELALQDNPGNLS